ncbi:acyloxyacyl hydrolase [Aestuariivita sp.]|jgi:hypothetical protein|uniref:acyloxyacyl hydrolase n=1 Tax=Aestuariivita sp. TaxID=1872407 RepID=UPI00216DF255|nr:acyloxyacyl hydrolase [Aestuariivita sp.]MCE8006347.1 acyloxyacyl hydrolase [Aestuariivita sp.]
MKRHSFTRSVLLVCLLATPAASQEMMLGVGHADYARQGTDTGILSATYRHTPFYQGDKLALSFGAHVSVTGESDVYVAAGLYGRWAWPSGWFVDLSLMPGLYDAASPGNDLGTTLNFRSLLGVGYRFENERILSVAVSHKSNAGIDTFNPGVDALLVRYHVPLKHARRTRARRQKITRPWPKSH